MITKGGDLVIVASVVIGNELPADLFKTVFDIEDEAVRGDDKRYDDQTSGYIKNQHLFGIYHYK